MGKIVAIGGGCIADEELSGIKKHIFSLAEKERPHVLFLPTASFDSKDDAPIVLGAFEQLGCTGEALYLTDEALTSGQIRETVLRADIIYVDGGNLKFLMDVWNRTGVVPLMREAYEKGTVLSGVSSGAMCWFDMGYDDCGPQGEYVFVDCVGLLPFCNCPHFDDESWQSFSSAVKELNRLDGIAVENSAAFCVANSKSYVLKSDKGHTAYLLKKSNGFERQDASM